jgi:hypothetical protein
VARLDAFGEDRREPGAARRQALRHLLIVELDVDHERCRLNLRRRHREAAGLRLPGRDRLQHRLDALRSRRPMRRATTCRGRRTTTICCARCVAISIIWHTHYHHIIENHAGVVEWFKGSTLRPFLGPLDAAMRETFTANYTDEIRYAYPARSDGRVMLKFPRLFILAVR